MLYEVVPIPFLYLSEQMEYYFGLLLGGRTSRECKIDESKEDEKKRRVQDALQRDADVKRVPYVSIPQF